MILGRSTCRRQRDALAMLADPDRLGEPPDGLLEHIDGCSRCRLEAEAAVLTVHGLRRLAAETRAVSLNGSAWPRLRARLDRPREPRWRWRASLASLLVGSALVAGIAAPAAIWPERLIRLEEAGTDPSAVSAFRVAEAKAEVAALDHQRFIRSTSPIVGMSRHDDGAAPAPSAVEVGWSGPDGRGVTAVRMVSIPPPADRTR
jgi:hypothetical protein